jgi:membrane protein YqaA with SNARE-associated domain
VIDSFFYAPLFISYFGLFIVAFLSASLLPLGSAWLVVLLLSQGEPALPIWAIATLGNVLGSVLNYVLGVYASDWVKAKQKPETWDKAEQWFARYGIWSMLFSWVPIVGDPLTLVAGVLRANFMAFLLLVTFGKAVRYAAFIWGFDWVMH